MKESPREKGARAEQVDAYVALGSNVGSRARHLAFALRALGALPDSSFCALSRIYETEPVGPPPQRRYLNCVASLRTRLPPHALLRHLLEIEAKAGRVRGRERDRPRTLDLDLLLYGGLCIDDAQLQVPHPRLSERPFVLEPLCDLAPRWKHPSLGATIRELAQRVRDQKAVRIWRGSLPGVLESRPGYAPASGLRETKEDGPWPSRPSASRRWVKE